MAPLFERHGIRILALSKDTVEQAALHKGRDGLPFDLLADPELRVIRAFGLLHEKALEFRTWTVAGIPLGLPSGKKTMAIPTTLIVDEKGIVRWIDQADDYRIRGDEKRITDALAAVFGDQGMRR